MIKTRKDLKDYITADLSRTKGVAGKKMWIEFLKGNRNTYCTYKYIKLLRHTEFWENNKNSLWGKFVYLIFKHRLMRYQIKTQIFINTNIFDKGLNIQHPGYIWADISTRVGCNCTILPRVLFGKKKPGISAPSILVGDNCYIGTGSTILGPVTIGNNVTIAAGSVVIHDIPDNCLVAGNPAVVKKQNISSMQL